MADRINNLHNATVLFLGCYMLVCCSMALAVIEKRFTAIETNVISDVTQRVSRSEIACASACSTTQSCQAFSFNGGSELCYMSPTSFSGSQSGATVFTAACPYGIGYALYTINRVGYCLKYYASEMYADEALAVCHGDDANAHFISVTSRAMLDGLTLALETTFNHGTDTFWGDGRDAGDTDQGWRLQNGAGSWMTWFDWGSGDPDYGAENCIRIEHSSGIYKLKDMECYDFHSSYHFKFLCQIDI